MRQPVHLHFVHRGTYYARFPHAYFHAVVRVYYVGVPAAKKRDL